jgi:penicillin-binding protein 1A
VIGLVAAVSLAGVFPDMPRVDLPPLPPIQRDAQVTYVDRTGAVIGVRGGTPASIPSASPAR